MNILFNMSVVFGSILLTACSLVEDVAGDRASPIVLINDEASLAEGVEIKSEEIAFSTAGLGALNIVGNESEVFQSGVASDLFNMTLVAEVASPSYKGQSLRATSLYINGNVGYVSYNVEGETQMGGIEVFDLKEQSQPKRISRVIFTDRDVNYLHLKSRDLFFTGALSNGRGAYLTRIRMQKNKFTKRSESVSLKSFAGNSIHSKGSRLYVSSGDVNGFLSVFNRKKLSKSEDLAVEDARSVFVTGSQVRVLAGQPARLLETDRRLRDGFSEVFRYGDGLSIPEAKAKLLTKDDLILMTLGKEGFSIACRNGEQLLQVPQIDLTPEIELANSVTNSIAIYKGLVFTANGEGGVYAYRLQKTRRASSRCGNMRLTNYGFAQFSPAVSANDVYYRNNHLFVATAGGLKVLKIGRRSLAADDGFEEVEDFDDDED